ncbi:MAG: hypothetical protein IJZ03_05535 [Clostridia bacterium]|nr:hypothetical protein [Clostridia bacterium]
MKKIIALMLITALLSSLFVGCTNKWQKKKQTEITGSNNKQLDSYESFVYDVANDGIINAKIEDFNSWDVYPFKKGNNENVKNKSYTYSNNTYVGSYEQSLMEVGFDYYTDQYYTDEGFLLSFRDDTQELVLINLMDKAFFDTEPYLDEVEDPVTTALQLAEETATKFVDDLNEYTRTMDEPNDSSREKDGKLYPFSYYKVNYTKKYQGFDTVDSIHVVVTSKGNVCAIIMGDINSFDTVKVTIDKDKLNESVLKKAHSVYNNIYKIVSVSIDKQFLGFTSAGELCAISDVSYVLTDGKHEHYSALYIATVIS